MFGCCNSRGLGAARSGSVSRSPWTGGVQNLAAFCPPWGAKTYSTHTRHKKRMSGLGAYSSGGCPLGVARRRPPHPRELGGDRPAEENSPAILRFGALDLIAAGTEHPESGRNQDQHALFTAGRFAHPTAHFADVIAESCAELIDQAEHGVD